MIVRLGYDRGNLTGPLVDGTCVRQSFVAAGRKLLCVGICFATYKRANRGMVEVRLNDSRGVMVGSSRADVSTFKDNSYREFAFPVDLVQGGKYELLVMTSDCRSGNSVTAKWGRKSSSGHFFIGGRLVQGELSCTFHYEDDAPHVPEEVRDPRPRVELPEGFLSGLVTVVIPHYECPELLGWCLASLTRQTYRGFEVVVVDDGSSDVEGVRRIVGLFKALLHGIRLVELGENRGAPRARNVGASRATGEFLFFLDADCRLYPRSMERLVRVLVDHPGAAYSYGGFRWGDDVVGPADFDPARLMSRNYVSTMSMVRRSLFPGFDESLARHQDWDLWLTMLENGHEGICCGELLFATPRRAGGISDDSNIPMGESIAIVKRKHGLR